MKQYRIQRSDHLGVVNCAFGGRKVKWSPWKTVYYFPTVETAEAAFDYHATRGLTRWRLVYGKDVLRKSL